MCARVGTDAGAQAPQPATARVAGGTRVPCADHLTASFKKERVAAGTATPRQCWRLGNSVFGTDGDGLVTRPSGSHESVLVAPPLMIVCGLTRRTTVAVVLIAVSVSGVARVALTRRTSVIVIRVSIAPARLTRS